MQLGQKNSSRIQVIEWQALPLQVQQVGAMCGLLQEDNTQWQKERHENVLILP